MYYFRAQVVLCRKRSERFCDNHRSPIRSANIKFCARSV